MPPATRVCANCPLASARRTLCVAWTRWPEPSETPRPWQTPDICALGLFPDHDAALFLTVVVLGLFGAALTLLWLVYEHGRSATVVPDETEAPAE